MTSRLQDYELMWKWVEKWFQRFLAFEMLRLRENRRAAYIEACADFAAWLVLPIVGGLFAITMPLGIGSLFLKSWFPWLMFAVTFSLAWFGLRRLFVRFESQPVTEASTSAGQLRVQVWTFRIVSTGIFLGGLLLGGISRGTFNG